MEVYDAAPFAHNQPAADCSAPAFEGIAARRLDLHRAALRKKLDCFGTTAE